MFKKTVNGVLILSFIFCITACTKTPERAILGKWEEIKNKKEQLEFKKDGKLVIYDEGDAKGIVHYEFIGENRIKIHASGTEDEIVEISILGKELKWNVNNPAKLTIYKKIK
ncbi:MAG: hypothetical protein A2161_18965 [Candidatus Schekmanbacteria bacterium RBG_13_48_7]|uniref:Lipocalin-like domain-containing protein n=1 Tax=Candidatus Schekmanbacteria bacterium RBG_13_48_7 TaxID=1817878 RepID=A0A1F7RU44_9BACT|nr:MAG: hypothetical protein A2161_18965 [Candidatus Schekmanbacteria bacterium RBG_13_48_7]